MNKKEINDFFIEFQNKTFAASYSIIPDERLAMELVVESITIFFLREEKFLSHQEFLLSDKSAVFKVTKKLIFKKFLNYLYTIGQKKAQDYKEIIAQKANFQYFYQLQVKERFVLFAHEKLGFKLDEISSILKIPKFQVIETYFYGKNKLLNLAAINFEFETEKLMNTSSREIFYE